MMHRLDLLTLVTVLSVACTTASVPNQKIISGSNICYVSNSGICETTPNVTQYSGYATVGEDMHMWFWFFSARQNPSTAPLVLYLEGGPGGASEYGLFTQNGPCKFENENDTEPVFNPYSFNNFSNVLYLDNPIGTGFSYGSGTQVNNTKEAIPYVWNALQIFLDEFEEYQGREFGIFTESFGGRYGPELANYILQQNHAVRVGSIEGKEINLKALGLANAAVDTSIKERANIEFAYKNEYRPLINESLHDELLKFYEEEARPALANCTALGTREACYNASRLYYRNIEGRIVQSATTLYDDFVPYDVRKNRTIPPMSHVAYLQREDVRVALGAKVKYRDWGGGMSFLLDGDDARSSLSELTIVVQAGINVVMYTGDADYVCNWLGTLQVANAIEWSGQDAFKKQVLEPYNVDGQEVGTCKSVDNLTFVRVFGGGHNVMWYHPVTVLSILRQTTFGSLL
ncbi:carboxypeptidase S1, CPD-S1 [Lophiotrema nucula]|uniref:Carboxypeptidase S1, CPD-S1 n=1 Tax=Lophiotrema nucula TaxID=690887 RepID=A0A6A5YUD0_9PLEO|nr:carboxypeptidase S1, CPD-S1 [Lophiotrema nucula]